MKENGTMDAYTDPGLVRWSIRIARAAAVAVAGVAVLVLLGWSLGIEALQSRVHPERSAMNPL
ncbi:MAG TPA: hypothetical protein VMN39_02720, partial [Longimicrobiaceae bacterium]|nr:hypothetical protein [Longimicrobiaceae bacterium]